jgi:RNA-splicing ligase RtcB
MRYCKVLLVLVAAACLISGPVWAQTAGEKGGQTYIDLMRKDMRKEKQSIVDQAMALDAAQKSQFWAIYAEYQTALDAIWDQRFANIKAYADSFNKMTDALADQLAVKAIDLERQRAALRQKYYQIFKDKMGARTAARFLQVEFSLACLIDLQLASEIPLLE